MPESLRLYLDQMLQTRVAQVLRQAGYDVLRASETGQSRADDQEILRIAIDQRRILITLDEHFGDWAVLPLSEHFGVIRNIGGTATAVEAAIKAGVKRVVLFMDIAVDGSLIQKELGFMPQYDLRTGWEETIREMQEKNSFKF